MGRRPCHISPGPLPPVIVAQGHLAQVRLEEVDDAVNEDGLRVLINVNCYVPLACTR